MPCLVYLRIMAIPWLIVWLLVVCVVSVLLSGRLFGLMTIVYLDSLLSLCSLPAA